MYLEHIKQPINYTACFGAGSLNEVQRAAGHGMSEVEVAFSNTEPAAAASDEDISKTLCYLCVTVCDGV